MLWCYPTTGGILKKNDSRSTESYYNRALNNSHLKRCRNVYENLTQEKLARCKYIYTYNVVYIYRWLAVTIYCKMITILDWM